MKKYLFFIVFLILFIFVKPASVFAITPTSTPSATKSTDTAKEEEEINKLKDRIASRVAELKLVERRGIIGTVSDVSNIQLSLTDLQKNTRFVDVDELTKFSSPSAKETFGISDISKGNTLGVLGLYNKQTRRLLARFVNVLDIPLVINAAISKIDNQEFTITVLDINNKSLLIDVQTTTKTSSYTKDGGLAKAGFSKIKVGERITVVGFPSKKDPTTIIPDRVIVFPDLPINPKIVLPAAPTNVPTAIPTSATSSAKKTVK